MQQISTGCMCVCECPVCSHIVSAQNELGVDLIKSKQHVLQKKNLQEFHLGVCYAAIKWFFDQRQVHSWELSWINTWKIKPTMLYEV